MTPPGRRVAYALAAAFFLINLVGLSRSPTVWADEVTLNDAARELALRGELRMRIYSDVPGFERRYYWQPPAQTLLTAAVYRVFGFGIVQTRVMPLLFGAAVVVVLFELTWLLFRDNLGALLAAGLFVFNFNFLQSSRSGRMDAQCLFFALLGTLFCARAAMAERSRWKWAAAGGLALGLAAVTHPTAVFWVLGVGIFVMTDSQRPRWKPGLLVFLCAAVPLALWLGYAMGDWPAFRAQFIEHALGKVAYVTLTRRAIAEAYGYLMSFRLAPLLLPVYLVAIVQVMRGSGFDSRSCRLIAGLLVTLLLPPVVMKLDTSVYHFLHPLAVATIPAGVVLSRWFHRHVVGRIAVAAVLANVLVSGIGLRWAAMFSQWPQRDYAQVAEPIRRLVPPGSRVCGVHDVWYAVEWAGSSLESVEPGKADGKGYDFVIIRQGQSPPAQGYELIEKIGQELPPILGRLRNPTIDYRMEIWRAKNPATSSSS